MSLVDDILYGNSASQGGGELSGTGFNSAYCDVQGGIDANDPANHVLNAAPLFVRAPGTNGGGADYGDLHLQPGSPCAGAGTAKGAPPTDRDGRTRPESALYWRVRTRSERHDGPDVQPEPVRLQSERDLHGDPHGQRGGHPPAA